MSDNIDTRVSLSLHPSNVREQIEGYDDETAGVLAPTMTAFDTAYQAVIAVHTAREAAKTNPTWNEAQQVIHTDDLARRKLDHVTRSFDSVRSNLDKGITAIEQQLTAPITSKAAQSVAAEVRAYAKTLPTGERMKFIQDALNGGDDVTATAVLGAPAYLSGIDANTQSVFTRMYHERNAPAVSKRLKVMVAAKEMIEQRAGIVFREMEKAVSVPPHKAKALREAKTAAEKHFVMTSA